MPEQTPAPRPGTLSCPQCGAEAAPASVRCAYCGSSLATVACPECFGSLFVGMAHCPWCGAAASREVAAAAVGACPRCAAELHRIRVGAAHVDECAACGGLWIDTASFERICAEREEQEAVLGAARAPARAPDPAAAGRHYIPCPVCGKLMHRTNFAGCSGVIIDCCKADGTWFDYQELQKVILFIREGGMKKARAREKERLAEESARLRRERLELETRRASDRSRGFVDEPADAGGPDLEDIIDVVRRLFR